MVRTTSARSHPRVHPTPTAGRDRAGDRAGLRAIPPALATRHSDSTSGRASRCPRGDRTTPRFRAAGRRLASVLPARVEHYRPEWLDELCWSGEVAWGRLGVRNDDGPSRPATTSSATPITLLARTDLDWLLQATRGDTEAVAPELGATAEVVEALRASGASWAAELATHTRRLPVEIDAALWDGVARGLVTADGFAALRSLLAGRRSPGRATHHSIAARRGLRRAGSGRATRAGRWSLLPQAGPIDDRDALAEAVAEQLLARWGVLVREVVTRESLTLPWRDVLWALRRMEARGTVRGGRFVTGFVGEQYAAPEAVDQLRSIRRATRNDEVVELSATDPLNLVGILTPGPRIPAVRTNCVRYRDGLPVTDDRLVEGQGPEDQGIEDQAIGDQEALDVSALA